MKYTLSTLLIYLLFACGGVKAQYVNIPDTAFRSYLVANFPNAFNASQQLDTTNFYIINTGFGIDLVNSAVKNLDGVQYFKKLKYLWARMGQLETIPVFPDSLKEISLEGNKLTSLPPLPATLTNLVVLNNKLTSLPDLPNKLEQLLADFNYLTALPALPDSLNLLSCGNNLLTTMPVLPGKLGVFVCDHNKLPGLPTLPAKLWHLACGYNYFTLLPYPLPDSLTYLYCDSLNLTSLPALPQTLQNLSCNTNKLTSLPPLPNKMQGLQCHYNLLTSLPTLPDSLSYLECSFNQLTSLPNLSDRINSLNCSGNQLTGFVKLPSRLGDFACSNNNIDTLPELPASLTNLQVSFNHLTKFPALPQSLRILFASSNNLASLPELPDSLSTLEVQSNPNLSCLPFLPSGLGILNITGTNISCISNLPVNPLFYMDIPRPICNAVNNASQCQAYPQVYGYVFNDNNRNGIFDIGDVARPNVKALLSNGAYAYTNAQGVFNIAADTIGSYNVTVVNPAFFNAVPLTFVHNLPTYTSEVHDTFALQPNIVKDSLGVHITSASFAARPGFPLAYHVNYDNPGTSVLSPKIVVKYDGNKLIYDSSSVAGVVNSPDSISLNAAAMLPGDLKNFILYFRVKTNAILGSPLKAVAIASAMSASYTDTSSLVIRGSYDPNDKQATPAMTPTQVAQGNFIDYTVRFQNTGTDTAFNVVIADTLSTMLQNNVLQIIGSSHQCRTTLRNGIVYFEFLNINLPDSNASYLKSNGFIRFRIQPQTTVTLGDDIPNKASIYFYYNAPVNTNTVQTHIQASLLPLQLLSYHAALKENKSVINQWITANELNTSHFNIQRSANGREFNTIGKVNADGRGHSQAYTFVDESANAQLVTNNPLYYRLQITDRDGSMAYSKIETVHLKTGNNFTIHPNPAHYTVTVEGGNLSRIEITDDAGRIVMSKALKNEKQPELSISSLPAGIYMMRITTTSGTVKSEKLVIE